MILSLLFSLFIAASPDAYHFQEGPEGRYLAYPSPSPPPLPPSPPKNLSPQEVEPLIKTRSCDTFSASASYALLQVGQQGLGPTFVSTSTPGWNGTAFKVAVPRPSLRSAVEGSFSGTTAAGWNIELDYFLLPNSHSPLRYVPHPLSPLSPPGTTLESVAWQWNNQFNYFALTLSKKNKGCSFFAPYLSLLYVFEQQFFNTTSIVSNAFATTTQIDKNIQHWSAFGPSLGAEMNLPLSSFSFFFTSSFACFPARSRTESNSTSILNIAEAPSLILNSKIKNSFHNLATRFDFVLGIRIRGSCFFLEIDWRGEIWPDHLQQCHLDTEENPISPNLPQGDLSMQGGAVTLGAKF